jgi:putative photosynthetic complex assembly protein
MSEISAQEQVPRAAVVGIALLLAASVLMVAAVRLSGVEMREPDAPALITRSLRFEDRPDGSIAVIDAPSGRQVESISGEQGFLRGALRALARERRSRGLGAEQPFELIARSDGRLTLHDRATGERIDLESFGPTNAGAFARLLTLPAGTIGTTPWVSPPQTAPLATPGAR